MCPNDPSSVTAPDRRSESLSTPVRLVVTAARPSLECSVPSALYRVLSSEPPGSSLVGSQSACLDSIRALEGYARIRGTLVSDGMGRLPIGDQRGIDLDAVILASDYCFARAHHFATKAATDSSPLEHIYAITSTSGALITSFGAGLEGSHMNGEEPMAILCRYGCSLALADLESAGVSVDSRLEAPLTTYATALGRLIELTTTDDSPWLEVGSQDEAGTDTCHPLERGLVRTLEGESTPLLEGARFDRASADSLEEALEEAASALGTLERYASGRRQPLVDRLKKPLTWLAREGQERISEPFDPTLEFGMGDDDG